MKILVITYGTKPCLYKKVYLGKCTEGTDEEYIPESWKEICTYTLTIVKLYESIDLDVTVCPIEKVNVLDGLKIDELNGYDVTMYFINGTASVSCPTRVGRIIDQEYVFYNTCAMLWSYLEGY
jgi:hypothetical protein